MDQYWSLLRDDACPQLQAYCPGVCHRGPGVHHPLRTVDFGKLVSDREIYDRTNKAVQELTQLVQRLNNENGTLAKLADPELYRRLDSLTRRGDVLITRVEQGEGTIGKLVAEDELYVRMDKLLSDMESLVADLKQNPTKYFTFSVF